MDIQRIHHVAYRCKDAKQTVEWYRKHLGMDFVLAIAEDKVPSTGAPDPYMHIFMDAGNGNILAFFELPNSPEMGRDGNTPNWVQHLALKVGSLEQLEQAKQRLEAAGIEVVGITDHTIFKSIYFFDPNGHPRDDAQARRGVVGDARGVGPHQARTAPRGVDAPALTPPRDIGRPC